MIPSRPLQKSRIVKFCGCQSKPCDDVLAVEEPLEIRLICHEKGAVVEKSLSITMRTPESDFELAAGFLFTEGIIQSPDDIQKITYCAGPEKEKQTYNVVSVQLGDNARFNSSKFLRHFYANSSCGVCGKASLEALEIHGCPALPKDRPVIRAKILYTLPEKLRKDQEVFGKTGGLHAAVLFDSSGTLISLKEDVGRHNALDKLIGEQFLEGKVPLNDFMVMVSGRSSFEIVQKSLMAGIPMVVAVGPPSSLAVDLAQNFGVTLIGFLREGSFNIYSAPDRVAL